MKAIVQGSICRLVVIRGGFFLENVLVTGFCGGYLCGMNINELKPDGRNYNKGTDKGRKLVKRSLKELGAGRSVLVDKDGNIIAGNKTYEAAKSLGYENVLIVPTDGKTLVAVQRTDIELDSEKGRALALADNATASAGLEWDYETLAHDWGNDMLEGWGIDMGKGPTGPGGDGNFGETPFNYVRQFAVAVIAESEAHQEQIYNDLIAAGYKCKVLAV